MAARSDIMAGKAYVSLYVREAAFIKGLRAAQMRLRNFGAAMQQAGGMLFGLGAGVAGPLLGATKVFADAGDKLHKLSLRTGLSSEALSELGHAAELSGTNIDQLGAALFRMRRRVANAATETGPAVRALEELGLSAESLTAMSTEDQFMTLTEALADMENESRAAQLAFEVFGDNARQLMPLLQSGADGINDMREQARELGLTLSTEDAQAAADLTDALGTMWSTVKALTFSFGGALAPAITDAADFLAGLTSDVSDFIRENRATIIVVAKFAGAISLAGVGLVGLGLASSLAASAIGGFITVISAAGTVVGFLTSPITLLVGGLTALGAWFVMTAESARGFRETVASVLDDISKTAGSMFAGIRDALMGGDLELAGQIAVTGLRLVFLQGMEALKNAIGGIWGDTLSTIGGQIVGGEFQGAWETAVLAMSSVWDSWAQGVIETFTSVAQGITDIWESSMEGLANWTLRQAARGGIFGKAFAAISGVDVSAEQARAELANQQLIASKRRVLATAEEDLAAARSAGNDEQAATQQRLVDDFRRQLADLEGSPPDLLGDAAEAVSQGLDRTTSRVRSFLDAMDEEAAEGAGEAAEALRNRVAAGSDLAGEAVAELKNELAGLRGEAARRVRERERVKAAGEAVDGMPGTAAGRPRQFSSVATFSAAALLAMGHGGQEPTVRAIREQNKLTEKQIELMNLQLTAIKALGLFHP